MEHCSSHPSRDNLFCNKNKEELNIHGFLKQPLTGAFENSCCVICD